MLSHLIPTPAVLLAATLSGLCCLGSAHAEQTLFVVTPAGNLYTTPPAGGEFELLAQTQLPLQSVQQIGDVLFLGSQIGLILRYDMGTEQLLPPLYVASDAVALAAHEGDLLVGGFNGQVLRVDIESGASEVLLQSDWAIEALAVDDDVLYASTPLGAYQEADLAAGTAFELGGFGVSPVNALGQTNGELYVAEADGVVRVYDKITEGLLYAYPVDNDPTALVPDGQNFLIGGADGTIQRVTEVFGQVLETYTAPEPVAALWLAQPLGELGASTSFVAAAGGAFLLQFDLQVPLEHAGDAYRMLGSLSGSSPGFEVDGLHIPLNPDAYFSLTLAGGMDGLAPAFTGIFDSAGQAQADFQVPAALLVSAVGLTVHHAFYVFERGNPGQPIGMSGAVRLEIF